MTLRAYSAHQLSPSYKSDAERVECEWKGILFRRGNAILYHFNYVPIKQQSQGQC